MLSGSRLPGVNCKTREDSTDFGTGREEERCGLAVDLRTGCTDSRGFLGKEGPGESADGGEVAGGGELSGCRVPNSRLSSFLGLKPN